MKGYKSKWEKAHRKAKAMGYKETDFGYINVVKQVFAKLIVGWNTTIAKVDGKLKLIKNE
jgi:intein-encoded DNA endonuclease-like protein